ncbi:condensation domain-containing protein [Vibrio sp. Of14-4]|uniref:condensation domain-containing protein n=1 Tax=Vibrio sp. Of14-4 TaxID=2724878 RepID=UPI001EF3CE40|nr:condensation domain-containing protein [Vibrio sp. Of14-4]MCG7488016.1 condensation domain-containing protein [Vibrio sp. Of14-4]
MSQMTPMQAACWFGRESNAQLGGVASHLYIEFDGENIDLSKLSSALVSLYHRHEMLRLTIVPSGECSILDVPNDSFLEVDDFSHLCVEDRERALAEKRHEWAHQTLDLTRGQAARFSVSLISDTHFRLHIDTDMIAVDPDSCRIMIEDLAMFYEGIAPNNNQMSTFFSWHEKSKADPELKRQRKADKAWWKSQLDTIAPAPSLPFPDVIPDQADSQHYSAWFDSVQRNALVNLARQRSITPSNLMLGIFARALGKATGDETFRVNVPTFWRPPIELGTENIVGDFVNFVVLSVDLHGAKTLLEFCNGIADRMALALGHSRYDGVNIMRDLSVNHGQAQLAPIVFTSAIDLPSGDLFSSRVHKYFGKMNWTISQGSQVALDSQVVSIDGGLMINWDVRQEAMPEEWTSAMFEHFIALTKSVIADPCLLDVPLESLQSRLVCESSLTSDLNPMQRAYLLGRTTQMPLGGVAMQEVLEYRGSLSPASIRRRLSKMVVKYPCLRAFIDSNTLKLHISKCPQVNISHFDLSHCTEQEIDNELVRFRYEYSHTMFELEQPLWNITTFCLPDNTTYVFARFDALVLDARSIASLLVELFNEQVPLIPALESENEEIESPTKRAEDENYWLKKLSSVEGPIDFPWKKPLELISRSRYQRQSLEINKDTVKKLIRVGGKQGLYKNTVMMAAAMEALAVYVNDGKLCVAVPVLPMMTASYSSQSSFIALQWEGHLESFVQRAISLQSDTLEGLGHLSFSGVDLARILFDRCGPAPTLPIVITNGLSWPAVSNDSQMILQRGITQTPQVAMDVRFVAQADGAITFSIDYAVEAINDDLVKSVLNHIDALLNHMAESTQFTAIPLEHIGLTNSRVSEFFDLPPNNSNSLQKAIFDLYCRVIGVEQQADWGDDLQFTQLGLRPNHLKQISAELNSQLQLDLPIMQLIRCRDANEVSALAEQQMAV